MIKGIFYEDFNNSYIPHILQEMYIEKVYEPFFRGKKDMVVLDIGGNIGLFSHFAYDFSKRIVCMEPSKQHVEVIKHMLKYNGMDDKVDIVNAALSNNRSIKKFYHNTNKTMFSLEKAVDDGSVCEEVKAMTLMDLLLLTRIDHVDFMKLDIEGSEFEVIASPGFQQVADKIEAMVVEVHAWAGRNPSQITTTLRDYGFDVWSIPAKATLFGARRRK